MDYNLEDYVKTLPEMSNMLNKHISTLDNLLERAGDDLTNEEIEKLRPDLDRMNEAVEKIPFEMSNLDNIMKNRK